MECRRTLFWSFLLLVSQLWGAFAASDLDDLVIPPPKSLGMSTGSANYSDSPSSSPVVPFAVPSSKPFVTAVGSDTLASTESANLENKSIFPSSSPSANLNLNSEGEDLRRFPEEAQSATITVYITMFFAGCAFLFIWYKKQIKGKLKANRGLPIQTLGQTWLDGQTRVIVLRIGGKVLILAKSTQFCTTLDVITDPDEVNRLTLGSGDLQGDEDFSAVLKEMNHKSPKDQPAPPSTTPTEEHIRSDLEELKRQLGNMGSKKK